MKQQPDLTVEDQQDLLSCLSSWLNNGMTYWYRLSRQCELPHCYNRASVMVNDPQTQDRARLICDRCAKMAEELVREYRLSRVPEWKSL